jgi:hypothetical protein
VQEALARGLAAVVVADVEPQVILGIWAVAGRARSLSTACYIIMGHRPHID